MSTPKRSLEVGDRVKLRGYDSGGWIVEGERGVIAGFTNAVGGYDLVIVSFDRLLHHVTPSQCRRIVPPKPKLERYVTIHAEKCKYAEMAHIKKPFRPKPCDDCGEIKVAHLVEARTK